MGVDEGKPTSHGCRTVHNYKASNSAGVKIE